MNLTNPASEVNAPSADAFDVFKQMAEHIQPHLNLPKLDEGEVERIVDERINSAVKVIELRRPDAEPVRLDGAHCQFEELMQIVGEGHRNVLFVGPAGSGKTTLAKDMAKALSLPFAFISLSGGVTESHLLGRVMPQSDGSWKFQGSRFVEVYVNGGVFLLDEIDAADANVMVSVNAALANGVLALPDGQVVSRHPDCYIVAAANTFGRGANAMYVGRNALDAATLDRFVLSTISVTYDEALELRLATGVEEGKQIVAWVKKVREAIESARLRRIASTRLVVSAVKAVAAGSGMKEVARRYFRDWSTDELAKLAMTVIHGNAE